MQILKPLGLALLLTFSTTTAFAEVTHIDNEKTNTLLGEGIPLIDVRMKSEWEKTGVVDGSHLLTFFDERGNYDIKQWTSDLEKIAGKDKPFMLTCAVGGRTRSISHFLDNKMGFSKVHNVEKGIVHWIASDQPVITYDEALSKTKAETEPSEEKDATEAAATNSLANMKSSKYYAHNLPSP